MILCSDINYFCAWYKRILNIAVRSNNKMLSNEAQGILDYYKEDFDEVF